MEFPMHAPGRGPVLLSEVLLRVRGDEYVWSILDYVGVGLMPLGMTAEEFEKFVRSFPGGYIVSWEELKDFAGTLEEAHDILIVAANSREELVERELQVDDFSRCSVVIQAMDSTRWSISIRE